MKEREEYMENRLGEMIPTEAVKTKDIIRDDWVNERIEKAESLMELIVEFRMETLQGMMDLEDLLAQDYGVEMRRNKKGNRSFTSYNGKLKVERDMRDIIVFDEQIHIAKELIDECLEEWTKDGRVEIKAIVQKAFKLDNRGRMNIKEIKSLRQLDFKDDRWIRAMEIIADSEATLRSKTSVSFQRRPRQDSKWQRLDLRV